MRQSEQAQRQECRTTWGPALFPLAVLSPLAGCLFSRDASLRAMFVTFRP